MDALLNTVTMVKWDRGPIWHTQYSEKGIDTFFLDNFYGILCNVIV